MVPQLEDDGFNLDRWEPDYIDVQRFVEENLESFEDERFEKTSLRPSYKRTTTNSRGG